MFSYSFDEDSIATSMFLETLFLQYYENNYDIYDDGIKLNEILLVSRLIYYLLNRTIHMNVDDDMAPLLSLTSLSIS